MEIHLCVETTTETTVAFHTQKQVQGWPNPLRSHSDTNTVYNSKI